jgi:uncharacterized protein (TIGR02145 family)
MELEADETAGFILFKLGATLEESQRAMRSTSVSIEGSYTHPPRSQRLEAIRKGWEKARGANPAPAPPHTPTPTPTPTPPPVANKMTDIDGNQYDVIKIGNQLWMKENLKVSKYRNGEAITTFAWANTNKGAYAIYDNENANNNIYGKLYNWYAVSDSRGLCPSGWHVPSDNEWTTLTNYLGGQSIAGKKIKTTGTVFWQSPNTEASNESGFSALPGGFRSVDGSFNSIRNNAFFWSATENDGLAWCRNLYYYNSIVNRSNSTLGLVKSSGASVRCLKD